MTHFDEAMPIDSTEHDTDLPLDETNDLSLEEETVDDTAIGDAAMDEAIELAEEFAKEYEELLLQEGDGDVEDEPEREKPKKKRKSKKKNDQEFPEELPEAPEESEEPGTWESDPPEDDSSVEDEATDEESLIVRRRERPSDTRHYMDEDGKYVEDVSSPYREHHQRLSSAFNRRGILSGYIEGFELNGMDMPRAFLYAGDIKVVIPLTQLDLSLSAEDMDDPLQARLEINAILGAKIFYMVLDINFPSKVAIASRAYANRRRRNATINHVNRDGSYKIKPGVLCTAQLVQIAERYVKIDIYGFETSIGIGEISNLWVNDIRELLDVGSEVMVEIVTVERSANGEATSIQASLRLAERKTGVKIQQGMTYTGTVSGFSPAAYFVRVSGVEKDVRCPIGKCYTGKLIETGDYVKFFVDSFKKNEPSGAILKILKKTSQSLQDF